MERSVSEVAAQFGKEYPLVIGGREMEAGAVAVRDRIDGDLGSLPLEAAIEKLKAEVASRAVRQVAAPVEPAVVGEPGSEANEY